MLTIAADENKKKRTKTRGNFINFKQELKSSYKPLFQADNNVLKKLISKSSNPSKNFFIYDIQKYLQNFLLFYRATDFKEINNEILRRHFLEKTEKFIRPLETYFNLHLMPRKG